MDLSDVLDFLRLHRVAVQSSVSDGLPQAAPEAPAQAALLTPQATPQAASQAALQTVPQAALPTASEAALQAAPQTASQAALQTVPQAASQAAPQAAMIGYAVTDDLELVFDTVDTTRKAANLRKNPQIALVIGGWDPDDPRTVQYEGVVDEPAGEELVDLKAIYYEAYPDGPTRLAWPGLLYFRVKPRWIRFSDYRYDPPQIFEFDSVSFPAPGGNTK